MDHRAPNTRSLFFRKFSVGQRAARRLILAAAIAVLSGPAGFPAAVEAAEQPVYTLGAGDQLRVTVFGHEDLSGEFQVDGSGSVSLPLIGNVRLGGSSVREAERTIIEKLKPDFLKNPRVNVSVLNYRPFYIIGEVKRPGSYPYVNGMTVLNAVALGGGYTYRAREGNIFLTRGSDEARTKTPANHETPILPGDVVEVPERFF